MRTTAVVLLAAAMFFVASAILPRRPAGEVKPQVSTKYPYTTQYFTQDLDHFNFMSEPQTWQQRFLVNDQFWDGKGPIFFYTGNEGDITMFYENTGFMFDIAPKFNALIVFAEHRYYGESMPFGAESLDADKVGYLSVEQALADFATLITEFKVSHNATSSPVISFGGSYGGMLSAWFRIKYPHIVAGAIAASAPVLQYQGIVDPELFSKIITDDFATASPSVPHCAGLIRTAFQQMATLSKSASGRATLSSAFDTCAPLSSLDDAEVLVEYVNSGLQYMAMTGYPYPSDFLQPMPGWPVKVSCEKLVAADSPAFLDSVKEAVGVYYNFTGQHTCTNITTSISAGLGDAWNFQACTEMVLPISANGIDDMFPPAVWNLEEDIQGCKTGQWKVSPRPDWMPVFTGARSLSAASNIVFSNGDLDPWKGGGIVSDKGLPESIVIIVIKDAAHHYDLRAANPLDTPFVKQARLEEVANIKKWIDESYQTGGNVWPPFHPVLTWPPFKNRFD